MNKKRAFIRIFIFFLFLSLPGIIWGVLGVLGKQDALNTDTKENRNMHSFDSSTPLSEITAELEKTYNDHVPFRSLLLLAEQSIESTLEIPYSRNIEPAILARYNSEVKEKEVASEPAPEPSKETVEPKPAETSASEPSPTPVEQASASGASPEPSGQYSASDSSPAPAEQASASGASPEPEIHEHNYVLTDHRDPDYENYGYDLYVCECGDQKKEMIEKLTDESYFPLHISENGAVYGRNDWLFFKDTLGDFRGSTRSDEEGILSHVSVLTEFDDICKEKGIELHYLILPNKNSIYPEYMPTYDKADERLLEQVSSYIAANTGLSYRYAAKELIAEKPFHTLFYKHDTHWNAYGIITGINVLYEMLGLDRIDPETTDSYTFDHGQGDLAVMTGDPSYANEEGLIWNYKPDIRATVTWKSSRTLHHEAFSEAHDKRTLVIIGDSFCGNPEDHRFLDFLPQDFAHVAFIYNTHLTDEDADLIRSADIIVVESVERRYIRVRQAVTKMIEMLR